MIAAGSLGDCSLHILERLAGFREPLFGDLILDVRHQDSGVVRTGDAAKL